MFLKIPSFSFYIECDDSRSSFTKNLGIFLILIFFRWKCEKCTSLKSLLLLSTERRRNLVWDGECIFLIFFQRSILFTQWAKTWRKIPFWQKHLSQKAKINVFFNFFSWESLTLHERYMEWRILGKISFFWDQSRDMSSSSFLPQKQAILRPKNNFTLHFSS